MTRCSLWILPTLIFLIHISFLSANFILDLSGSWTLYGPKNITVPTSVPGCVYTDLKKNGLIGDPLYRSNFDQYSWIGDCNWTYVKQFQVPETLISSPGIDLICEGIDTVAEVEVNNVTVGVTENMFRRYIFSLKNILKVGENTIKVLILSPMVYITERAKAYPYYVPPDNHYNFIRKAAYSFGWDWGPPLPSVGIWKNIYIESYQTVSLREVVAQTIPDEDKWLLKISSHFDLPKNVKDVIVTLIIKINELNILRQEFIVLEDQHQRHITVIHLSSNDIELWWPNGMGKAKLYDVEVSLVDESNVLDVKNFFVGFRKVELVQEKVNEVQGLTFYFKINDIPLFIKGSNWIPASNFQGSIDDSNLEWLLESAVDANMNMLRVWGGGVYESEQFYKLADKLGIMIWQDFMFACALYPSDGNFLENVRLEVIHQVRRLSHHPSVVLWSGNNENEEALMSHWYVFPSELYKKDYIKLYVDTIRNSVIEEDLSRPFVTSSPSNGLKTIADGWLSDFPQSTLYGDIHSYLYAMDGWDPSIYRIPRFASEFGFQSWSSYETLKTVSILEDLSMDSDFVQSRQRHPNGNSQMMTQIMFHFDFPKFSNKTQEFLSFIYLTQIDQAMSIKTEVEHYRRYQNILLENGEGLTMGAMYWQLNDVWQAPTWSSIEYGGKWKLLHYFAKKFYSQHLVSPLIEDDNVSVYFIQDETQSRVNNYSMSFDCFDINNFLPGLSWAVNFNQTVSAEVVYKERVKNLIERCKCKNPQDCLLLLKVYASSKAKPVSENFLFLSTPVYLNRIPFATVTAVNVELRNDYEVEILLKADNIALFVIIEAPEYAGKFSENGFFMTPSETFKITFSSRHKIGDVTVFAKNMQIKSLSNIYH